ncbi:MAG: type II toxin-antitoxin system PemK/MazF family toxin [Deltaproteobacteria bacterium]|nr:type II toxin-antitoxin system PemK/MazF family toxin [Deltaproteobacteria bacterium]
MLNAGDIVLVSFPFTDLSQIKLRPALIISKEEVHQKEDDYTLLFISSVIPLRIEKYEVLFEKTHPDFKMSGLKKDSVFKTNKLATVQKKLIKRYLGKLGPNIKTNVEQAFHRATFL